MMMPVLGSDSDIRVRETSSGCASIAFKLKNFNLNAIDAQLVTLMPSESMKIYY
jgi:hypothetical protein